jgi:hypothetical protein
MMRVSLKNSRGNEQHKKMLLVPNEEIEVFTMKIEKTLYWILVLISVTTIISGIVQMFIPAFILGLISAETAATTRQCFPTVGMFMFFFGGLRLHILLSGSPPVSRARRCPLPAAQRSVT